MKAAILLGAASVCVFASGAVAQTATAVAGAGGQADTGAVGIEQVVVTAQRRAERLQDVPMTVAAVSADDLARSGVNTIRDLQTIVPGFTFGGQGTTAQPAIRGVSTSLSAAGSENPVALYVDGIYQSAQTLLNVDMPDVERIEVLKGPQGTLFGRNATGGAVRIFTKGPSDTPTGDFTVEQSYYTGSGTSRTSPRTNLKGFVAGPIIPDVLMASLSASYDHTDGFITNDATGGRTGVIWKRTVRGKLLFTPTNNLRMTLGLYDIAMNLQGNLLSPSLNGLSAASAYPGSVVPTQPWHAAYDPGDDIAKFRQYGFTFHGALDLSIGTISDLVGYNNADTVNYNSIHAAQGSIACQAAFACIDYHFEPTTREISEELNFASRDFGMFSFVTGLFYYHASGSTLGIIQEGLIPGGVTVQRQSFQHDAYAVYGEGTFKPTDSLAVILGLRYSAEGLYDQSAVPPVPSRSEWYHSVTPRVSVRYAFTPELNAYATYTQGFKSGLTGITNTAIGFTPVAPEKLTSYEVGLKYGADRFSVNASLFYYDYKNKQEQTFTGTSSVIRNTGPVRIYGLDLDATGRVSEDFTLKGALTWVPEATYRDFSNAVGQSTVVSSPANGYCTLLGGASIATAPGGLCPGIGASAQASFNATGMRLIRAPKVTASGTISYLHPVSGGAVDASATIFYSSAVKEDITGVLTQGGYVAINAQGGYRFENGLRLGLFVRNLTNEAYMTAGLTSSSAIVPTYAPPREVGISLNYAY